MPSLEPLMPHSSAQDIANSVPAGETLLIANEFTAVTVRKMTTGRGDRLLLTVQPEGKSVLLDPMQLEAIAGLLPDDFSRMLAAHLGASDDESAL